MRNVVWVLLALGIAVIALSFAAGITAFGVQGAIVVACGAIPAIAAAVSGLAKVTFPRWAAAVCVLTFLVAGMKTSDLDSLSNIMMAAFVGAIVSLVLVIKPYRPAAVARR